MLLRALSSSFKFLPENQRQAFLQIVSGADPMKQILLKQSPIQLKQQDYQKLREQVLRRDGWRCQLCGSMTNLEVHHKEFRSHRGADDECNLITLCCDCHSSTHGYSSGRSRLRGNL